MKFDASGKGHTAKDIPSSHRTQPNGGVVVEGAHFGVEGTPKEKTLLVLWGAGIPNSRQTQMIHWPPLPFRHSKTDIRLEACQLEGGASSIVQVVVTQDGKMTGDKTYPVLGVFDRPL